MTKLLLFICLYLPFTSTESKHEYYVGLTEITYNEELSRVEIISRLFYDDLEKVLKERYFPELVLKPSIQSENIEVYLKKYIAKKLTLNIDGNPQNIEYLGYKFEEDRINLYLKISEVKTFNKVTVNNLLLTDKFEDQKNIVHCFKDKQKESVLLTKYKNETVLKFN